MLFERKHTLETLSQLLQPNHKNYFDSLCSYVAELLLCLSLQLLEVKGQFLAQNSKSQQSLFSCRVLTHQTLR